ncbi:ATP synthase subunit O, mitochondrial-like [Chenopodium quinoa]|uniref:ATP synthase subunit O, mitochondrial-like n=1 Tax=Chenopodium quinoa TaxID=63459 RepID=UPI000B799415|nr:ATP synthase subunit O, mitochondrial-like [Chenopodium quinoa]
MAMSQRIKSSLPLIQKFVASESLSSGRSSFQKTLFNPNVVNDQRNYATSAPAKKEEIRVPFAMFGGSGNYASALYLSAAKANDLDKVESELFDLIEASKKSPRFSQFTKDISVSSDVRIKAMSDICAQAKFSDITRNFLVIMAEYGRLKHIESIAKRFSELTMAHRGELKAIVTTVIPLPPAEEKELKETLQELLGQGKKVQLEQKIDPSILGGLVVEFGQKVFDMSIRTRAKQMERFLREPVNL